MAALTTTGASSGTRWILTVLVHGFQRVFWPQNAHATTTVSVATPPTKVPRHYPPQRDRSIERAAMAREMFRL